MERTHVTNNKLRHYTETCVVLGNAGFLPAEIEMLFTWSRSLHRLNEINCNVGLTEKQDKLDTLRTEQIEKLVKQRNERQQFDDGGVKVQFGGDPRGFAVRLVLPNGKTNCFAGEGWGIE
jgi:hypothetical protein